MKKLIIILFSFLLCSQLFAANFKEIVIFGDSLSDNGNLYDTLKIVPKSPPYFKGRFTNGTTWAENVGKHFYDKFFIDYKIYAWGGATAILHNPAHDPFVSPINLEGELNLYLMNSLLTDKSKVLYFIWIGANDYLYEQTPNLDLMTTKVVNKITWAINKLKSQGAQHFVILNLPDLSKTPFAKKNVAESRLQEVTQLHNSKLNNALTQLSQKNETINIVFIDIYSLFNDLVTDPEKYNQRYNMNIKNTTEACWKGTVIDAAKLESELRIALTDKNKNINVKGMSHFILNSPSLALAYSNELGQKPCDNAQEFIFWDELHPSETVHKILSKIVAETLEEGFVVVS